MTNLNVAISRKKKLVNHRLSWRRLKMNENPVNLQSADQGLMIRSLVPEEPTGETDCSTVILSQR
jgi:hypothetical protein